MGKIREIVFEAHHPAGLARFWSGLLDGYAIRPYDAAEIARLAGLGFTPETDPTVLVDGPGPILCFQKVEGRHYEKNRIHFDITVPDRKTEAVRLVEQGAIVDRETEGYTVMRDPEGNQFCLVERD